MNRRDGFALVLLCAIQCLEACDIFLLGKVTPLVAATFDVAPSRMVGAFILQQLGLALGALVSGSLLDRTDRLRVLTVAAMLSGLSTCVVAMAPGLVLFAMSRFVSGLFIGAASTAVITIGATLGQPRASWVLTVILACNSLGVSAGSLYVLYFVSDHGWRPGFWLIGTALTAVSGVVALVARRTALAQQRGAPAERPEAAGAPSGIARFALCYALTGSLIAVLASWSATFFFVRAGVSLQAFAGVSLLYAPAALLGMLGSGALAGRIRLERLVIAVFTLHAAALIAVGVVPFGSPLFGWVFFASIVGQTAGQAVLGLSIRQTYDSGERGRAFGTVSASSRCGGIAAPALGAWALEGGLGLGAFYALAALVPLATLLLLSRSSSKVA